MQQVHRDPIYIAEQLKLLRKLRNLKQENLAELAGVSTRTIEKAESGRHAPNEQTLRSIARGLEVSVAVFDKPTPEQEAAWKRELERAARKTLRVPIHPIRTAQDFLAHYDEWHALRWDNSALDKAEALEVSTTIGDWFQDLDGVWGMCSISERLSYARSIVELCQQVGELGYAFYMGRHRQRSVEEGKPDLVFTVGLAMFQKQSDADAQKYALVELENPWEVLEEDRLFKVEDFLARKP